jgi:hypothetical protein
MKPNETPLKDPIPVYVFHIPEHQSRKTNRMLNGQQKEDFIRSVSFLVEKSNYIGYCSPEGKQWELFLFFRSKEDMLDFIEGFKKLLLTFEGLPFTFQQSQHPQMIESSGFREHDDGR